MCSAWPNSVVGRHLGAGGPRAEGRVACLGARLLLPRP